MDSNESWPGNSRSLYVGINLLCCNFYTGDFLALESKLRFWIKSDGIYHSLCQAIIHVIEYAAVPINESREILLTIYQHTPCSLCREAALGFLAANACLPAWMAEECCYDANPDIVARFGAPL